MCGIVGMAGDIRPDHRKAFKDMLLVCQVRGRDSTGAFRVTYQGTTEIAKQLGTPEILLDSKKYDSRIDSFGSALVGHCRSKTFGDVTLANAHPFKHGSLTGVHNGTLRNVWGRENFNDFGTDSEWLYHTASREGMEDTITTLDNDGAWALVWWDEEDKTLNFLRNDKRPLWFTMTKDMKVMLWASEIWMFGAFHRHFELWDGGKDGKIYWQLPVNQLHKYRIDPHGKTAQEVFTITQIKEIAGQEVRRYQGNVGTTVYGNGGKNGNGGSVDSPFRDTVAAAQRVMGFNGPWDDPWDDLDDDPWRDFDKPLTNSPADASTSPKSEGKSSKDSSNVLDFRMGKTDSKSGKKSTLSLPKPSSNSSQQGNSGGNSNESDGYIRARLKKAVSLRTVSGIPYISSLRTSREWSEQEFDEETGGKCCYCKNPIGDLSEVNNIFERPVGNNEEEITFICDSCVSPKCSAA